jgi:hypothetical protein
MDTGRQFLLRRERRWIHPLLQQLAWRLRLVHPLEPDGGLASAMLGNLELERVATLAWTTSTRFGRDAADLRRFRDWLVGLALCIHRSRS